MKFVRRIRLLGFFMLVISMMIWIVIGLIAWLTDIILSRPVRAHQDIPEWALLLAIVGLLLYLGAALGRDAKNRRILANGEWAEAIVLRIEETGAYEADTNDPEIHFWLEVRPLDRPHFQAEAERLIENFDMPKFQPGKTVEVKYDPRTKTVALCDPKRLVE